MVLLLPLFLSVATIASAQNLVSGVGRLSLSAGASPSAPGSVRFSSNVLSSAVGSIVSSVSDGPNRTTDSALPTSKLYGVNFGNWLVSEPWMNPTEWLAMGGEFCESGNCEDCRQSEWSLAMYLGQNQTNAVFKQHWETWLTQDDVSGIAAAGLNTVRIPVPFWIVEDIVDWSREPYAQGGLDELIRGLYMFKDAGLNVILDHHALPGVSSSGQMFAGNCTTQVEFYNSEDNYNYKRAVTWSIVMAYLSHTHPAFETVFSIEAVNEPTQNATQTPGIGDFYTAFVHGIRAIEASMDIICDDSLDLGAVTDSIALSAFVDALPIIAKLSDKYGIGPFDSFDWDSLSNVTSLSIGDVLTAFVGSGDRQGRCLSTQTMNQGWQGSGGVNPADSAIGPQIYDNHLYFNFGGVAPNATEDSYMTTICNNTSVAAAALVGNAPMVTGEWSLATAFNATDDWLKKWSDAQKMAWAQGGGWLFWNWKIDTDAQSYPILGQYKQWSYKEALAAGLFTADPATYFDDDVCAPYLNTTSA